MKDDLVKYANDLAVQPMHEFIFLVLSGSAHHPLFVQGAYLSLSHLQWSYLCWCVFHSIPDHKQYKHYYFCVYHCVDAWKIFNDDVHATYITRVMASKFYRLMLSADYVSFAAMVEHRPELFYEVNG